MTECFCRMYIFLVTVLLIFSVRFLLRWIWTSHTFGRYSSSASCLVVWNKYVIGCRLSVPLSSPLLASSSFIYIPPFSVHSFELAFSFSPPLSSSSTSSPLPHPLLPLRSCLETSVCPSIFSTHLVAVCYLWGCIEQCCFLLISALVRILKLYLKNNASRSAQNWKERLLIRTPQRSRRRNSPGNDFLMDDI